MRTILSFVCALLATAGSVFWIHSTNAQQPNLSVLAKMPDWNALEEYHGVVTREDFTYLLTKVYAPGGNWKEFFKMEDDGFQVKKWDRGDDWMKIRFAENRNLRTKPPRYWKATWELEPVKKLEKKPLDGVHITLDPGHLGGPWAKLEERWFQIGEADPVMEGDMVMIVANHLERRLKDLGAKVTYTRKGDGPVTSARPETFYEEARAELERRGVKNPRQNYDDQPFNRSTTVQGMAELIFYRYSEIDTRAEKVNTELQPDLVLALHFNAEPWGDPADPDLTARDHFHILIHGTYSEKELSYDDQRFEMLLKLLNGSHFQEAEIAKVVAPAMAKANGLPAYRYPGDNARQLPGNRYVWKRNLRANRLFQCPVIYLEPYVMNAKTTYERIQMGDYSGVRNVEGQLRKSIFREYADSVAEGLAEYYQKAREEA